jgi:hypothetical protein
MIVSGLESARTLEYVSRSELAEEFSISERAVDELVSRGVFPNPSVQTSSGPRWCRRLVDAALVLPFPVGTPASV